MILNAKGKPIESHEQKKLRLANEMIHARILKTMEEKGCDFAAAKEIVFRKVREINESLRSYGTPVLCELCRKPGGTLVKTETGYRHAVICSS